MARVIRSWLKALRRDDRGLSVVEFGLAAPFLGLLVVGISDYSRAIAARFALEQAANRTLEMAAVGSGATKFDYLKPEAAAAAGVPESAVTLTVWLECDGVKQGSYDNVCGNTQSLTRYVQIAINSTYTPLFNYGPLSKVAKARPDGKFPLHADASMRVQ